MATIDRQRVFNPSVTSTDTGGLKGVDVSTGVLISVVVAVVATNPSFRSLPKTTKPPTSSALAAKTQINLFGPPRLRDVAERVCPAEYCATRDGGIAVPGRLGSPGIPGRAPFA